MPIASAIRLQVESRLARKFPSALTPAQKMIRPVMPTGITAVDQLLDGGLPVGSIIEMTGPESSGRTSLALSYIAGFIQKGGVCAWIDACDSLHVESAAAADVDLSRLLWVRCGATTLPQQATDHSFSLPDKYLVPRPVKQGLHGGGLGSHPRNETKGISTAIRDLLRSEVIAPRCSEPQPRRRPGRNRLEPNLPPVMSKRRLRAQSGKPWLRIEQALGATDLLLQGGGFSAVVLDLAGINPEYVSRVELSIWFRYRAAVERTQASLLLLTQHPCAKSAGELLLRFHSGKALCDEKTVFAGVEHRLEIERRRFAPNMPNVVPLKKPVRRERIASWRSQSTWAGAR